MFVTGHRSCDGVRLYKTIFHEQQEELSDAIQVKPKKPKLEYEEDKETSQ